MPQLLTRSFKRSINYRISEWKWMVSFRADHESTQMRDNWLREFLCELPELIEQIPKVKEIGIKSIVDPYREKFAKIDQELEENSRALEESLDKANGTV
ncbi:unnamed protein product, partial [Mesorhabditis belari]|uniref:Uncharacterized protein n=1 Tax=Mesorhabditis belari TaxID=2138241 RepID=A0AAF3EHM8_9BILA